MTKYYITCPSCELLSINGVPCHETGCEHTHSRWDAETDAWVKRRKCFQCGCWVDYNDDCCNGNNQGDQI